MGTGRSAGMKNRTTKIGQAGNGLAFFVFGLWPPSASPASAERTLARRRRLAKSLACRGTIQTASDGVRSVVKQALGTINDEVLEPSLESAGSCHGNPRRTFFPRVTPPHKPRFFGGVGRRIRQRRLYPQPARARRHAPLQKQLLLCAVVFCNDAWRLWR